MLEGHLKVFQEGEEFYFPGTHVKYYPLLTIGQMIEFLDEHYRPAEITLRLHTGSESDGHRRRYDIFVEGPGEIEEDHLELCDALWAAVREILER